MDKTEALNKLNQITDSYIKESQELVNFLNIENISNKEEAYNDILTTLKACEINCDIENSDLISLHSDGKIFLKGDLSTKEFIIDSEVCASLESKYNLQECEVDFILDEVFKEHFKLNK